MKTYIYTYIHVEKHKCEKYERVCKESKYT